ncbi:hypothetical protein EYF80_031498 [Liparis tanakae]|uniref:Uncharacterized protein n=1 Tax=Liparis tanakae TaxID=230148 RepID=A0A4Z2GXE1_9TELE|nr:hypothetical protein EYF80_031498 [Liparis tanakae]
MAICASATAIGGLWGKNWRMQEDEALAARKTDECRTRDELRNNAVPPWRRRGKTPPAQTPGREEEEEGRKTGGERVEGGMLEEGSGKSSVRLPHLRTASSTPTPPPPAVGGLRLLSLFKCVLIIDVGVSAVTASTRGTETGLLADDGHQAPDGVN